MVFKFFGIAIFYTFDISNAEVKSENETSMVDFYPKGNGYRASYMPNH